MDDPRSTLLLSKCIEAVFSKGVPPHLKKWGFVSRDPGFNSRVRIYFQASAFYFKGFIPKDNGFISKDNGFISKDDGFISKEYEFIQGTCGFNTDQLESLSMDHDYYKGW